MSVIRDHSFLNTAGEKIRSKSGASITFALLLFLVCAILSAVILVVGTTSAGRMSGLAETDQRYYTVNSAAQLITDGLDGKTISMFKIGDKYYRFYKPMNKVTESDITTANEVTVGENSEIRASSFSDCVLNAYFAGSTTETFHLNYAEAGDDIDKNVTAKMTANTDTADTVFEISNTNGKHKYTLLLTFSTDVRHNYPPLLKDDNVSDPVEISWHVNRTLSKYDDTDKSVVSGTSGS